MTRDNMIAGRTRYLYHILMPVPVGLRMFYSFRDKLEDTTQGPPYGSSVSNQAAVNCP